MPTDNNNVGTIYLSLAVDDGNLNSQITGAGRNAGNALTNTFGSAIGKIGKMFMAAFAIGKVKDFLQNSIDRASDLAEVQNVVDTAFESMAYKAEEFAKIAGDSFGISETTAKRASGTYMAMAKGMGVVAENASTMSVNVAKLAADVASFYNLNYEEAETKLKGIFTGETEGLKSLGVVMTETNLEAFRMQQGIQKTYKEMTAAEKTTLRYKFVMQTLGDAQGDFAKTSDGWANSTRQLSEAWGSFMAKIGTTAINVLTPALNTLKDFVSVLNTLADDLGIGKNLEETADGAKLIGDALSEGVDEGIEEASQKMLGLVGMDEIQKLGSGGKDALEETAALAEAWMDVDEYMDVSLEKRENKLLKYYEIAKDKALELKDRYLKPFFEWGYGQLEKFRPVVEKVFEFIKGVAMTVGNTLRDFWNEHGESIKGYIETTVTFISGLLGSIFDGLLHVWNNGGSEVFESIGKLLGAIFDAVSLLWQAVQPFLSTALKAAIEVIADALSILSKAFSGVVDIVTGFIKWMTGELSGNAELATEGIGMGVTGVNKVVDAATNTSEVPTFARGGIVSGPTLAYVGEYAGAKSNPEVVAPLSDLKAILAETNKEGGLGHLTINIGGKTVADLVATQINKQTRRRNNNTVLNIN